jgi:hypothetical protein
MAILCNGRLTLVARAKDMEKWLTSVCERHPKIHIAVGQYYSTNVEGIRIMVSTETHDRIRTGWCNIVHARGHAPRIADRNVSLIAQDQGFDEMFDTVWREYLLIGTELWK